MTSTPESIAETRLQNYQQLSGKDKTADLLRALLRCAPSPKGRGNVAVEINACVDDYQLNLLSQRYLHGLLVPVRAQGGRTPSISRHPSRPSAEINAANLVYLIDLAKRDQQTLKDMAHARDNYRCVLSGFLDNDVALDMTRKGVAIPQAQRVLPTTAAHIIPFSIAPNSDRPAELEKASVLYEILERFSGWKLLDQLNGENINRIENVITLSIVAHHYFGKLEVWLEAVEGLENTYILRKGSAYPDDLIAGTVITFTTATPGMALPSPQFLAIHAACAKVCHMCGMAEVIDKILRDLEMVKVLSEDGSGLSFAALHNSLAVLVH